MTGRVDYEGLIVVLLLALPMLTLLVAALLVYRQAEVEQVEHLHRMGRETRR